MTTYKEHGAALIRELRSHGIHDGRIDLDGKHAKLRFTLKGEPRFLVYPKTTAHRRSLENSLSRLRQVLGVRRQTRKRSAPRRQRNRTEAPVTSLSLTVPGDPFEDLARHFDPLEAALYRLEQRTKLAEYRLSFFLGSFEEWEAMRP